MIANGKWIMEIGSREPEGSRVEALKWDLQIHKPERPITGRVRVSVVLRRERPRDHFLPEGNLRQDAPLWAPVPREFLGALLRALRETGVLAEDCQIAAIDVEAFWAFDWDGSGYLVSIGPASESEAVDPIPYGRARRLLEAEVEGDPDFRPLAVPRPGSRREPDLGRRPWASRVLSALLPYRKGLGTEPGPLAIRVRVVRRPGHGRPDILMMADRVVWALKEAQIIRSGLAISELSVRIESGDEPRTSLEVWRLPEFGRQISAA